MHHLLTGHAAVWLSWRKAVDGTARYGSCRAWRRYDKAGEGLVKVGNQLSRHDPQGREGPVDPAGLDGVSSVPQKARGYNGMDKGQEAMMCQRHGAAWMAHNLGEHLVSTECNRHAKKVIGLMWIDDLECYEPL